MENSIMLVATVHGESFKLDVARDEWSIIEALMLRGLQKVLTDASSTCKGVDTLPDGSKAERKATPSERLDAVRARFEKIEKREYGFGGTGSRAGSPEEAALKKALIALIGAGQSKAYKWPKGASVSTVLEDYAKGLAKAAGKEFTPEIVEEVRGMIEANDAYTLALQSILLERKAKAKTGGLTLG